MLKYKLSVMQRQEKSLVVTILVDSLPQTIGFVDLGDCYKNIISNAVNIKCYMRYYKIIYNYLVKEGMNREILSVK